MYMCQRRERGLTNSCNGVDSLSGSAVILLHSNDAAALGIHDPICKSQLPFWCERLWWLNAWRDRLLVQPLVPAPMLNSAGQKGNDQQCNMLYLGESSGLLLTLIGLQGAS